MAACTFFGHSDAPIQITSVLKSTLIDLIENKNVSEFYVGNNGNFDAIVKDVLVDLKREYAHIDYAVVRAYLPNEKQSEDYHNTMYPLGLENVPPKYAICRRNEWMIEKSQYVVTYVVYSFGGAYKYKTLATKKKRVVINLADNS